MCNMNKILEKAKELVAMLEEKEISDKVELSTVSPGCVIDLGEDEFVVFAHSVLQTVGVGSKLKPEKEIQKDV